MVLLQAIYREGVERKCIIRHTSLTFVRKEKVLYREIIAVCSQIQTKPKHVLCGQKLELLNDKLVVHIVTTGL